MRFENSDGRFFIRGRDIARICPMSLRESCFDLGITPRGWVYDAPNLGTHSRADNRVAGIGDPGPLGRLLIRGEKGHDIIPELYPVPGEPVIDKPGRSAFTHTDFDLLLRNKGVKKLIIVGVTTDVCVHTTMRDADDRGIECLLVKEGCAAAVERLGQAAVETVVCEGGIFGAVAAVADVMSVLDRIQVARE
jgi:nicotinamidase-related amidase